MINVKKHSLIFLVILLQSLLAITGGFITLYIIGANRIPPAVYVEAVDVGNLLKSQAADKLGAHYTGWADNKKITVKVDDELKDFEIQLKDISGAVDNNATIERINGELKSQSFSRIINGYFLSKKTVFSPAISINEEKLKEKIKTIANMVYKDPVNAKIHIKDGKVVKVPGVNGKRINVVNAVSRIKDELNRGYIEAIQFRFSNKYELEEIYPEARTEDLAGVDEIISTYSTEIKVAENLESIKKAVSAINRVLVFSVDPVTGERAGIFSFNKYLRDDNLIKEYNDEGYNQVASTLHAAVIGAGIDPKGIARIQHKSPVDYIEAGLDVRVYGNSEDYKFRNSLDNNIVIFAEIKNNKIVVNLVGKKKTEAVTGAVKVEVVERVEPGVIEVESQEKNPEKYGLLSPGAPGLKVNVYRVNQENGTETEKVLLYSNEYQPKDSIIQIAPDIKNKNRDAK